MELFIQKPSIDLYHGVKVDKSTVLDYKTDTVEQHLEELVFHSKARMQGKGYESVCDTTIWLEEGDVLIFEEGGRGYLKPVEPFVTIREAIDDFKNIEDVG